MKPISEILNKNNNIAKIKALAKTLGFLDIKIFAAPNETNLQLVAIDDPNTDSDFSPALQAKLIELLQCEVAVLVDSHTQFVEALLDECADLSDKEKISDLFGKSYEDISFRDPDQDKEAIGLYKEGLRIAEKFLREKKTEADEQRAFFDKKRQTSPPPKEHEQKEQSPPKIKHAEERKENTSPKNKF